MNDKAIKLEFRLGDSIEDAVNDLLTFKRYGLSAYGEFNGAMLLSDAVTMDYAYTKITGKTKAEFDKAQQDRMNEYDEIKRKHKETIPEQTALWMEKGRKVLTEDKWDRWDEIVPIRLDDMYRGMELGNCLDIAEILNNKGTFEEAKVKIDEQGHSGMSFGLVCSMIKEFSDRGEEFVEFVR